MGVESQGQSQQQQQHILLPSCVLKQQQYCSGKGELCNSNHLAAAHDTVGSPILPRWAGPHLSLLPKAQTPRGQT